MNKIGGYNMDQVSKVITAASYSTSGAVTFLGLTAEGWGIAAALVGILGVIGTFAFNAWFKMKYNR